MIAAALERGIEVTGELELAWRALPNRFLAVTGTNGKTTTVELLGHIFRGAGEPVAVAGNVGVPLAGLVGEIDPDATVVCEASSFQLEDTSLFSPEGAIFLNLAPDHLDRHGDLPAYRDAKLRDLRQPGQRRRRGLERRRPRAGGRRPRRLRAADRVLPRRLARLRGGGGARGRSSGTANRCWRPRSSASPASTTSRTRWPPPPRRSPSASTATRSAPACAASPASPHRLEPVAEIGGVRFVNDSKATNVTSAAVGIGSFDGGVHAILGGSDKGEPFGAAGRAAGASAPSPPTCSATPPSGWRPSWRRWPRPACRCTASPTSRTRSARAAAAAASRRGRPAHARLRQLRRLPELRSARRALPPDRRRARRLGGREADRG